MSLFHDVPLFCLVPGPVVTARLLSGVSRLQYLPLDMAGRNSFLLDQCVYSSQTIEFTDPDSSLLSRKHCFHHTKAQFKREIVSVPLCMFINTIRVRELGGRGECVLEGRGCPMAEWQEYQVFPMAS